MLAGNSPDKRGFIVARRPSDPSMDGSLWSAVEIEEKG
jgi:hypothetical protein